MTHKYNDRLYFRTNDLIMNRIIGSSLLLMCLLLVSSCKKDEEGLGRNLNTHADWMTQLIVDHGDEAVLRSISMPEAHDAGIYTLTNCTVGGNECNTQTQDEDMTNMLNYGIRVFDVRPVLVDDTYYTEHVTECGGLGCRGDALENILQQTKGFLDEHSELVVFLFSHWCNTNYDDNNLLELVNSTMGDRLYKDDGSLTGTFINTPLDRILDKEGAKGKLVILYEGAPNDAAMRGNGVFDYSYLPMTGSYSNTYDFDQMHNDQLSKFNDYDPNGNALFEMSWTMTLDVEASVNCFINPDGPSIQSFALGANGQLGTNMDAWMDNGTITKDKIPNVINVDFADEFVTDVCIRLNALSLD